jgi:hypothetical protein
VYKKAKHLVKKKEIEMKTQKVDTRNETENYIVTYNEAKGLWELHRKFQGRTIFMKSHKFQTALIVTMREMEER